MSYAVLRKESEELFGEGSTVLVWLDFAANKAVEIPPDVRAYLTRG